jgi:prephenate dehydrogenase
VLSCDLVWCGLVSWIGRGGVGTERVDRVRTVAIAGVGLIGGSIGLALRARRAGSIVVGLGRDRARLGQALDLGAIDRATTNPAEAYAEADVVVVCTPVTRVARDVSEAARLAPTDALITDAGSTKALIVAEVEGDPSSTARRAFVGAHPIAGSEKKGAAHARGDLFEGRACVLTPTPMTDPDRLERARAFWSSLGCVITEMSPAEHDRALALTSHLPHAVAAALAVAVPIELLPLAAGAYRDGTRVAGSDADLWAGIFLANRSHLIDALTEFDLSLNRFRDALRDDDMAALVRWWEEARSRRSRFQADDPATAVSFAPRSSP